MQIGNRFENSQNQTINFVSRLNHYLVKKRSTEAAGWCCDIATIRIAQALCRLQNNYIDTTYTRCYAVNVKFYHMSGDCRNISGGPLFAPQRGAEDVYKECSC